VRCIRAAVEGIVLKESAAEVLVEAIHTVASGERWVPPPSRPGPSTSWPGPSRSPGRS